VNLEELRSVRRTERESSQLQHLRDSFYRDVADFIESRKDEYRRRMAAAEDPFSASEDLERLKDEVSAAEEVSEAIYERRVGKVVKMAAFAAADMSTDEDGMTSEERELFEDLVERIRGNRARVLDTLAGEAPEGPGSAATDATNPTGATEAEEASDPGGRVAGDATREAGSAATPGDDPEATVEADGREAGTGDGDGGGGGVLSDAMGGSGSGATDADGVDAAVGAGDGAADAGAGPDDERVGPSESERAEPPGGAPSGDAAGASGPAASRGAGTEAEAVAGAPSGSGEAGGRDAAVAGPVDGDGRVGTEAAAGAEADAGTDRVTVRLTRDVGAIFGVDEREYDLASEDVVTLPATNAEPLVDRGAAERLE
jgi:DNA replication factor GINS